MAIDTEAVMRAVGEYIHDANEEFSVDGAYLFGSFAKGTPTEHSDVDICFFLSAPKDYDTLDTVVKLLEIGRKYYPVANFEPHVFATTDLHTDNPFVKEVLRTGRKII